MLNSNNTNETYDFLDELPIGRKLYVFREDRKFSQSKLELEAGLSFGTISRIENGTVNPTKETLKKLAEVLNLDDDEFFYLIRSKNSTPTQQEINEIVKKLNPVIGESEFPCYLMDCEFRVWGWNSIILELFGIDPDKTEKYKGQSVMKILFLSEFNLRNKIPRNKLTEIITQQVLGYRKVVKKYKNEFFTSKEIRSLLKDRQFSSVWNTYSETQEWPVANDFYLNYNNQTLNIEVINNFLAFDQRFILVKYYPKDLKTAETFEYIRKICSKGKL